MDTLGNNQTKSSERREDDTGNMGLEFTIAI